ncbi:MAG: hypothetical protein CMH54_12530 [Myxococcales bacterium]|nr:hypothetical protein [Myxococcales bacterium]
MAKQEPQKILRVGIIQADTVLEERLIRRRQTVTIGTTPKCTFIVPLAKLKRPIPLIQYSKGMYWLAFVPGTRGRVSLKGQVLKLSEAENFPGAEKRGNITLLPLDGDSRGKVRFHDLTVLFQFVTPPPTLPKPQLPASARGNFFRQFDLTLVTIMLMSLLAQGGGIGGVEYWWNNYRRYGVEEFRVTGDQYLYEQLSFEAKIETVVKKKEKEDEEEEKDEKADESTSTFEKKKVKPKTTKRRRTKVSKAPASDSNKGSLKSREKRTQEIRQNTILKAFGTRCDGDDCDGQDLIQDGVDAKRLSDAWDSKSGVRDAQAGEGTVYEGGPTAGGRRDVARLSTSEVSGGRLSDEKVTGAKRTGGEREIRLRIRGGQLGDRGGLGTVDRGDVASRIRRRKSAIRTCYERTLKKNPTAEGKITIQFTIGMAGRITDISVVTNSTNDSGLQQCIMSKMKTWKFPRPKGGSVTFQYPFILRKS